MFPSGGYFRSANCPFYVHGLCHRPYCHFRHAKPEYKPTSVSASSNAVEPTRIEKPGSVKRQDIKSQKITTELAERKVKDKDGKNEISKQQEAVSSTTSIFKRTALEEKLIAISGDTDEALSESDSDISETLEGMSEKSDKTLNNDVSSKKDVLSTNPVGVVDPVAKKFTTHIDSSQGETLTKDSETETHSETVKKYDKTTTENETSTKHNDDMNKTEGKAVENNLHENLLELNAENISETSESKTVDDTTSKKTRGQENLGLLIEDLQKYGKGVEVKITKKKDSDKDEINCDLIEKPKPEAPQLTDMNFFSSIVVKRNTNKKKKNLKASETSSGHKNVANSTKSEKTDKISKGKSKVKKMNNSKEKKVPETKEKSKIQRYKDLKKLVMDSEKSLSGACSSSKHSVLVSESDNRKKGKEISTILIESDSDRARGDLDDDSEENELLRIFNDYNPCDEHGHMDISDAHTKVNLESDDSKNPFSTSQSGSIKRPSTEKVAIGFKKQRVAHQPNHVTQRQVGPTRNSSKTFRRLPRPLQGTLAPPVRATISQIQGDRDIVASTHVKQRITHFAKSTETAYVRPRIRLEYGAKVPQSIRQKYLDKLVDEYLCIYDDQQEAFDKAEKEEKAIYLKCARRQLYVNVCVNLIKKLRDGSGCSKETDECNGGKRNPLAPKSSLPCPQKRLKIDTSVNNLLEDIPRPETVISTKTRTSLPNVDQEITEEVFYTRLKKYVMSEEELISNGFPRASNVPGRAEINDCNRKVKRNLSDPTRHICCRCGKPFVILESGEYRIKEECVYHHGRLFRRRTAGELITSYTCCQGESGCIGCSVANAHVRDIDWSEESGFMKTIASPTGSSNKMYALDCEMCYTTKGLELTRVTVVDYKLEQVYDTLVKPDNPIVDYNTRFSGITQESMRGIKTTLCEVQAVLLSMIHEDTILLGHSLESDLKSLKLIHSTVVDTSVVFPHRLGPPYKRALRTLMGEYVRKIIQDSEEGHDSLEDAVSCVELMLWKVKEDMKVKERNIKQ